MDSGLGYLLSIFISDVRDDVSHFFLPPTSPYLHMVPATSAITVMQIPCTDIHNNPFYCPAIPAHTFISSLRRKREKFRAKVHTYRNNRFVLKPFAAALDRCLFKGGGDSENEADDHDKGSRWRRSLFGFNTESECEDSSEDELKNISFGTVHAHIASDCGFSSAWRSLASEKSTTLGSLGFKSKKDKDATDFVDSDGFVTIPLATGGRDSGLSSGNHTLTDRSVVCARRSRADSELAYPRTLTFWEKLTSVIDTNGRPTHTKTFDAVPTSLSLHLKRKYEENNDTDVICDSLKTKRAKSNLSVSNSSFYVTVRREKLRFLRSSSASESVSAVDTREIEEVECPQIQYAANVGAALRAGANVFVPKIKNPKTQDFPLNRMQDLEQGDLLETAKALQDELFGPSLGQETLPEIQGLINKIELILPGIRIKERLMEQLKESASAQAVVDFLAEKGHLNARVLELFRASKVARMSLDESLKDADGLNLISDDLFFVFSKPNSFRSLTTLSLDGSRLRMPMLTHIQHLPRLTILSLFDTGIDNEAIYLLVPLRYTLADLNVAGNPSVDNDAVPALLMLTGLLYLSVAETSIGMLGARRLVNDRGGKRTLIDLPYSCYEYVEIMDRKYLVDPKPPLITDPLLCCRLSVAALKRNLSSHAAVNRDIPTGGTKKEMVQRLEQLLETRLADLEVRRMIRYPDQDHDDHDKMKKEEWL